MEIYGGVVVHESWNFAKAKEENEWSDKENEILIQFYKENEALWNHKLSSYKDRNLKQYNYQ